MMSETPLLDGISGPEDLREVDYSQLDTLAEELRQVIIETTSRCGGHIAPSLGVVELTIAIHRVFNSPRDRIIWDVGHQAYAHKLLTGRREDFCKLRQQEGMSGFPRREESPHGEQAPAHDRSGEVMGRDGQTRKARVGRCLRSPATGGQCRDPC